MKDMNPVNTTNAIKQSDIVDPAYLTKDPIPADSPNNVHQTGEAVIEAEPISVMREKREFAKGETFPVCPVHGNDTVWRHANHEHKTGDTIEETGHYFCTDGQHLDLNKGELFPFALIQVK